MSTRPFPSIEVVMLRCSGYLILALLLATPLPLCAQPAEKPHVDWEGNPLPAEAVARVGSMRFRMKSHIVALALSPDDKTLACICQDYTLSFVDAATGKLLRRFPLQITRTYTGDSVRFQPDGRAVAIYIQGTYRVLDVASGKDLRKPLTITASELTDHDITKDGKLIAVSEKGENIAVYDLDSGKQAWTVPFKHRGIVPGLGFTPDGKSLVFANADPAGITFYDAATGQLQFVVPQPGALRVGISPDGKRLAASLAGGSGPPVIWDLEKRKPIGKVDLPEHSSFVQVVFSPTGKQIYIAQYYQGSPILVDAATGKLLPRPGTLCNSMSPVFSKDGKKLFSGMVAINPWDLEAGKPAEPGPDPMSAHQHLSLQGAELLHVADVLTVVDWRTGRPRRHFPVTNSRNPYNDVVSADGRWIAFDGGFGRGYREKVQLMEAKTGKVVRTFALEDEVPIALQFAPGDEKLVCFTIKRALVCWDVGSGKQLFRTKDLGKNANGFTSSPGGRLLATYRDDAKEGDICIWHTGNDRPHRSISMRGLPDFDSLTFSSDGKILLLEKRGIQSSPGRLSLLDVNKGKVFRSFSTGINFPETMALSPDYRTAAVSTREHRIDLYEVATGRVRGHFLGHGTWVNSMHFHPDGTLLAATSQDAPGFIWDVYGKHLNKKPAVEKWNDIDGQRWWDALADDDSAKAFAAVRALVQNPGAAHKLLDERLQPVKEVNERRFLDLVKELGDDNFARRKKALAELEKLAEQVEAWMLRESAGGHPLEVQRRLENLLAKIDARSGPSLRGTRALEVLEQIGGSESERLIARLADGFPAARLTREAKETQWRLSQKRDK